MKEKIISFLKNKFNIVLIVLQFLAILSYFLNGYSVFFVIAFFVLEGVFLILCGIKVFNKGKRILAQNDIYTQLPMSDTERLEIVKKNEHFYKNNKFIAFALIILGITLIFSLFSLWI